MVRVLEEGRRRTLALVASVSEADLERVHNPLMSPLAWDLAHIAAYEDLWLVHRYGERPLLHEDLAATYDAFETPRAQRGDIELLGPAAARRYLSDVRARVLEVIDERGVGDGVLHEMVLRHEHQHNETMLQTLQLASLPDYELAGRRPEPDSASETHTGLELIEVPAGPCTIGAPADGFAYDNERSRHRVELDAFRMGRTPVTNGAYLHFVRDGGYERREWWCDEGWAWKEEFAITAPGGWTADHTAESRLGRVEPLHPNRPVVHVTWYEADAFARAHGVRLPSEFEWEKAASWDVRAQAARPYPWGRRRGRAGGPIPGVHANLDQRGCGTVPVGAYPAGASPYGCLDMIGNVWEWTTSTFGGYPGFVAYPYREYSEVFFGEEYRVLRGGSWATRTQVATTTFRNWDYPQRRQIFAGFRVASDA